MQVRPWIPLLLVFTAFGCGAERKLTGSAPDANALRASANATAASAGAAENAPGAVYVMSNAVAGNAVLAFTRAADGSLSGPVAFPTGGTGTGGGLGNQGALALGAGNRWLFVVNAGSNDVSALRVGPGGLELVDRVPSGGRTPVSLTVHRDLLYVLNSGGSGNIQGFRIGSGGALAAIPGSNRPLSGSTVSAAEIGSTPDGSQLVVSERATSLLSVYQVESDGSATGPVSQPSSGTTPFGFGFDQRSTLVVSEAFGGSANASAVSSYRIEHDGSISLVSGSVPTTQTAACWIAVGDNGRFAYTANAGSGSITGYSIARDGALARLSGSGVTAPTGTGPSELSFSAGSQYLYVLNGGSHTVGAYAVDADGALRPLAQAGGIPAGANGLAVR